MDTPEQYGDMISAALKRGRSMGAARPDQIFYCAVMTVLCDGAEESQTDDTIRATMAIHEFILAESLPRVSEFRVTLYTNAVYTTLTELSSMRPAPSPAVIYDRMEALAPILEALTPVLRGFHASL